MAKAFNVLFGLVIWGGLIYLVIFNILDSPSYKVPVDRENVSVVGTISPSEVTTSTDPAQTAIATSEINSVPESGDATQSSTVQKPQATDEVVEEKQAAVADHSNQQKKVETELQSELSSVVIPAGWYIQVGAFKNKGRAKTYGLQFSSHGYQPLFEDGDDGLTRILIGPYTSEEKAVLTRIKISEQTDAKDSIVRRISAAS